MTYLHSAAKPRSPLGQTPLRIAPIAREQAARPASPSLAEPVAFRRDIVVECENGLCHPSSALDDEYEAIEVLPTDDRDDKTGEDPDPDRLTADSTAVSAGRRKSITFSEVVEKIEALSDDDYDRSSVPPVQLSSSDVAELLSVSAASTSGLGTALSEPPKPVPRPAIQKRPSRTVLTPVILNEAFAAGIQPSTIAAVSNLGLLTARDSLVLS
ncbi:hypothetical protein DFJ73DRAFT_760045 [Zopfochytrium polystomum]|nr:hypothetical protein DFJ73DRAFT_760045 [Zopfochytrium polystomum]